MATRDQPEKSYFAFISYRHSDNQAAGRQWASWLHKSLETYQVPPNLVGKTNGRGAVIPEKIFPVFRDEEELPADSNLAHTIKNALERSQLLVVLCSPNAAASKYVAEEIDYFKKLGRSDRIIAGILAGEPNASWDDQKKQTGHVSADECFPLPLRQEYNEAGEITDQLAEPIAADFRININGVLHEGRTNDAAVAALLKTNGFKGKALKNKVADYRKQRHLMLLKIIAGVLGIPLGDLTSRDDEHQLALAKEKTAKLRRWMGALIVLAIMATLASITAYWQMNKARASEKIAIDERDGALIAQSKQLIALAQKANNQQDYATGLLLALNAYPGLHGGDRPLLEDMHELRKAMFNNRLKASFSFNARLLRAQLSPDNKTLLTVFDNGLAYLHSGSNFSEETPIQAANLLKDAAFVSNQDVILLGEDSQISRLNLDNHQINTYEFESTDYGITLDSVWNSPTGSHFVAKGQRKRSGEPIYVLFELGGAEPLWRGQGEFYAFSPGGKRFLTRYNNSVYLRASQDASVLFKTQVADDAESLQFSSDGSRLGHIQNKTELLIYTLSNRQSPATSKSITIKSKAPIDSFALLANGQALITSEKTLSLWQTEGDPEIKKSLELGELNPYQIKYMPASNAVFLETSWNTVELYYLHDLSSQAFKIRHFELLSSERFGSDLVLASNALGTKLQILSISPKIHHHSLPCEPSEPTVHLKLTSKWLIAVRDDHIEVKDRKSCETIATKKLSSETEKLWVSSSAKRLAIASKDYQLQVFSLPSLDQSFNTHSLDRINDVAFDQHDEHIAVASQDTTAQLWHMPTNRLITRIGYKKAIGSVAIDSAKQQLAVGGKQGELTFWSLADGNWLRSLRMNSGIKSLQFIDNNNALVIGTRESETWALLTGEGQPPLQLKHDGPIKLIKPVYKHQALAAVTWKNQFYLWASDTGMLLFTASLPERDFQDLEYEQANDSMVLQTAETLLRFPVYLQNTLEKAQSLIPAPPSCLSPETRMTFNLPQLSHEQMEQRGCSQFVSTDSSIINNALQLDLPLSQASWNQYVTQFNAQPNSPSEHLLMRAINHSAFNLANFVISAKPNIALSAQQHSQALHDLIARHYLDPLSIAPKAATNSSIEILKNPDIVVPKARYTALFFALLEQSNDVEHLDSDKRSLLSTAAEYGHVEIAEKLIARGAKPDLFDSSGWSPLSFAAFNGQTGSAELLLAHGANPMLSPIEGVQSPFFMTLTSAASANAWKVLELFIKHGAPASATLQNGLTALDLAVYGGKVHAVRILLENGADPNRKIDFNGVGTSAIDTYHNVKDSPLYPAKAMGYLLGVQAK